VVRGREPDLVFVTDDLPSHPHGRPALDEALEDATCGVDI